jgi:hypothetical protein
MYSVPFIGFIELFLKKKGVGKTEKIMKPMTLRKSPTK